MRQIKIVSVSYSCPICHKKLVQNIKGQSVKKYEIIQIFPEDLSKEDKVIFSEALSPPEKIKSSNNHIALCLDHAETYRLEPRLEEYLYLLQLKKAFLQNTQVKEAIITLDIEEEISEIITRLSALSASDQLVPLSLKALKIKAKLLPENAMLINEVQNHVLTYYQFINSLLAQIENHDLIASSIKKAFLKLDKAQLSQPEIFEQLSEWLLQQTGLPHLSLAACKIVISFFIQSCEVFYEIPQ